MTDDGVFNANTTALVLIEYQNDFASPGGSLHAGVGEVMAVVGTIPNSVAAATAARALGCTVIHAPISFKAGFEELSARTYGILRGVREANSFEAHSWGVEIIDEMRPQPDDIVLEGKNGLDTFASTDLDFILRSRRITTLALAGFLTNCCIESTMRTGYELGYEVVTLIDCVAAPTIEEHQNAIDSSFAMFSRPLRGEEFISRFSDGMSLGEGDAEASAAGQA